MTRNLVGPIPEPEDLHGRVEVIKDGWQVLLDHNLLLLAPRRFGKSGILRHFFRKPKTPFLPLSFDLEDVDSGAKFVQRIVEKSGKRKELQPFLKRVGGAVGDFVDAVQDRFEEASLGEGMPGVKFREVVEKSDWQSIAKDIMLSLEQAEQPILFLFDELPEMLKKLAKSQGDESAIEFMGWFRRIRLDERNELRRHRFVVAGSTGLNYLLDKRLCCPETLNDFERLPVEPLEPDEAHQLCCDLAETSQVQMDDHAIDHLLMLVGQPVPYFIQLFFSAIVQMKKRGDLLNDDDLDSIYRERLMGPICKRYFDQYRRRLQQYPPPLEQAAIRMLVAIARSEELLNSKQLYEIYAQTPDLVPCPIEFCELLADLECDWYLESESLGDGYYFYMKVMRDWWHRWYSPIHDTSDITRID